jgi:hypothetical protein
LVTAIPASAAARPEVLHPLLTERR